MLKVEGLNLGAFMHARWLKTILRGTYDRVVMQPGLSDGQGRLAAIDGWFIHLREEAFVEAFILPKNKDYPAKIA